MFRTTSGAGNSEFGLYVANIDVPICQENLGFRGPGRTTLEICGQPLQSGNSAELTVHGAAASAPALLLIALDANPTPLGDGTLVPVPWLISLRLRTDAAGEIHLPITSPGGGPLDVYAQLLVADPRWSSKVDLSNALRIALLP